MKHVGMETVRQWTFLARRQPLDATRRFLSAFSAVYVPGVADEAVPAT